MTLFIRTCFFIFVISVLQACNSADHQQVSLSGEWQFRSDPDDVGIRQKWFGENLPGHVSLPGSMKENGKGDVPSLKTDWTGTIYDSSFYYNPAYEKYRQPGNLKFPFWLTPNLYYKGAAWYRKEVTIPGSWTGKRITLFFERVHWQSDVWFDKDYVGAQNSLSTPHEFDLTAFAHPGKHYITVRIDNRLDKINVGPDSHSVTDHTQGNWNGITGKIQLQAGPPVFIEDIQLYPDICKKEVNAVVSLGNLTGKTVNGEIRIQAHLLDSKDKQACQPLQSFFHFHGKDTVLNIIYPMGKTVRRWDEFSPLVYGMTTGISTSGGWNDEKDVSFGMRDFGVKDGHFEINGRPVFLRGTVECCTFPLTGYPPSDTASWRKVFQVCRDCGLNHIRFHSYCPPEAAFIVADEMGFYLQPEAPTWPNHGTSLGDGRPVDQYILDETARIFKNYGNHPSFVMWSFGNEPRGNYVSFLDKALEKWKNQDKRRVYTGASIGMSWTVIPESQYLVRSGPRGLPFNSEPNSVFDYSEKIAGEKRPYVTHEMGQWCAYPDFREIPEFTGVYKAKNFELFRDELAVHRMDGQAHDFLMASGRLQVLCYKAEIEAALRTAGLDGFQLLGINDFPGQGTALVGMLDVFWKSKGYVQPEEIRHFCNQTVPLAEMEKFVFSNDEKFVADIKVAHFGPEPLKNASLEYSITGQAGDTLAKKALSCKQIPVGNQSVLGTIDYDLSGIKKAEKCKLTLTVNGFSNSWDFWVYPKKLPDISNDRVFYSTKLDDKTAKVLKKGGSVFLDISGHVENGKDIQSYFTPVFWNTSWFKMRPPHTLGLLVQNDHPAFSDFPTEYYSNYQWWDIIIGQQVMNIDRFPPGFKPLVQPIDTWFLNRRLAQLFEARIGNGKIVVSSLDLENDYSGLASRQLFYSIRKYMNSSAFNPRDTLELAVVRELSEKKERVPSVDLYTKSGPDELKPGKVK